MAAAIGLSLLACATIGGLLLYLNPPKSERPAKLPPGLERFERE